MKKLIEIAGKAEEAILGTVKRFSPDKGFGFIQTNGGDVYFHLSGFGPVLAGLAHPVFAISDDPMSPERPARDPLRGSRLVFIIDNERQSPLGKAAPAYAWGFASFYEQAEREISRRPVYRVVAEDARFNGQFARDNDPVVIMGNRDAIEAEYPRQLVNDPVGTVGTYTAGPCTRLNRWEIRNRDGSWAPTNDPRSWSTLVTNTVYRVWRGGAQLFHGHIGMLVSAPTHWVGSEFIFEVNRGGDWTEVSDPRLDPELAVKTSLPFSKGKAVKSENIKWPSTPAMTVGEQPDRKLADKPGAPATKNPAKATVITDLADLVLPSGK